MTNEIRVDFQTQRRSDIPTIGSRKKVRVNGRAETKHVKSVDVRADRYYGEGLTFHGHYILTGADGMWG